MSPYTNFELLGTMSTLCHFQFFQKYLLRMHADKKKEIFNKLLKHCLDNDKSHQHAKNGRHTF